MFNIKLPKTRYKKGVAPDYPNLEDRADGALIPLGYGDLHGVVPVCIDTVAKTYKMYGHAIHAIDAIKTETETLVLGSDYTIDPLPAVAQFSLVSTPLLAANTTYYFVVETDYAPPTNDHINLRQDVATYANGNVFSIKADGTWVPDAAHDLRFWIYGKATLSDQETLRIYSGSSGGTNLGLADIADRTRLAQSFLTGPSAFYLTRIQLRLYISGSPTGNVLVSILSAYTPSEVQVGVKSASYTIDPNLGRGNPSFFFPLQSEASNLTCDIEGAEKAAATIFDGADMLEDLVVTQLGKSASILDAAALADFKAKRTQEIAAHIDRDTMFGEIVGKLESSLLFKFAPLHDGTYAPTVYEDGEPAGTPHFYDEHFLSFSMRRDFSAIKNIVKVKYDENPGNNEFKVAEAESDVARFVYGMEETLEVETYHKIGANAAALASDYCGMYETSPLEITFEIRGYGLNLIPGRDKVKIKRTRAAYTGGTMSGVLFRIIKITKKPATASTEIIAILDTQTY